MHKPIGRPPASHAYVGQPRSILSSDMTWASLVGHDDRHRSQTRETLASTLNRSDIHVSRAEIAIAAFALPR